MGRQVFLIKNDGTTEEITTTDKPIKDVLETEESYVIVDDEVRKVYLWKGEKSSVRSKFIGAKRSQEIRGQVGMHYSVVPQDEGEEEPDFLTIIGGKTEAGIAKAIKHEGSNEGKSGGSVHPFRQKSDFKPPEPAEGMNIAGSKSRSENLGPLYTGTESLASMSDQPKIDFKTIMEKLEAIKIPEGYERELIIIGNHAYSLVEKVQTFLGKKQVEKVIEKVGTIPEGVFFAENYSPRILSEEGSIVAIEFLRKTGESPVQSKHSSKKEILKNQIQKQLEKK
jgi:hypothetical protein